MNKRILFVVLAVMASCTNLSAQKFQVNTNVVGLMTLGTFNGQIEYAFARHWSADIRAKYNPFSFGDRNNESARQFQLRQLALSAGARWWPWHIYSGWWLSGFFQWQEYNMGGIIDPTTEEGHRYGGGISAGYTMMVNPHFNIEFGLGAWAGLKDYVTYSCPSCGRVTGTGVKGFIMPSDVIIALCYVF